MAIEFDFKKRLGSGHFGEVWLAVDTGLGCEVAVKCIPKDKLINKKNFYQEAQVLKASEHQNIVKVTETGELRDGRIYVVMEYLENGSLEDEASGAYVFLSRSKRLMIDILRGLEHAHTNNIVHRDIKPANILIGDNYEGKLSDFGLALPEINSLDINYLKKYQYILHLAPEVNSIKDYTLLSDIYACGATFYRLVNGDNYLPQIDPSEARIRAMSGKFPDRNKYRDFIPISFRRVINKALNVDPQQRYQSATEMRHAIEQLGVFMDFDETILKNGHIWFGEGNGVFVQHSRLLGSNNKWTLLTKKGRNKNNLRRINKLCIRDLNNDKSVQISKKLLQRFVGGKV